MAFSKPIYDFLTENDNLATVLELTKHVKQFQLEMHKRFWSGFNGRLEQKLLDSEFSGNWKYSPYPTSRILKDWEYSHIIPSKIQSETSPYIAYSFFQGVKEAEYPLCIGVHWNRSFVYDSPIMTTLKAKLVSRDINISEGNWIYWGFSQWKIYNSEFLVNIYKDTENFFNEIVNEAWNIFEYIRPSMEQINLEVSNGGQS